MTDASRPQPEYGQYASPEDVARARGLTLEEHQAQLEAARRPDMAPATGASEPSPIGPPPATQHPTATPRTAADTRFARNRFATVAMLAFGLICTFATMPALFSFDDSMALAFQQQGLGTYSSGDLANTLGWVGIVGQVLLWVGALAASVAQLRRRRAAWWIPLTAGALAVLLVSAVMITGILADPAFTEYVQSTAPGTAVPG